MHSPTSVRYQVFVSSTFIDLKFERQVILHTLLEMGCIPVGMELFPAANEEQWSYIKRVIAECDYYVLISAGKYGSMGSRGLSYTEMEYRYACEIGKPVIALLHEKPLTLLPRLRETAPLRREMLSKFRKICQRNLCKYWTTVDSLAISFATSLIKLIENQPSAGWINGRHHHEIVADYTKAQQFIRKLADLNQVDFRYSKRQIVHSIQADGSGLLHESFTIIPKHGRFLLYLTRYGFHHRGTLPCKPAVNAWDANDKSPLSVCTLQQDEMSTRFAILLDRPSTVERPKRLNLTCVRQGIWEELLGDNQVDNYLSVERPCDELVLRFEAPLGRTWKSLRSTPSIGSVVKTTSKGAAALTWRMKNLKRVRLGYKLCLNED